MLNSKQLESNPSLYVFLPLFYTVWYDAVLTPSEIAAIEGLIKSQTWLTEDERKFLLTQIDPGAPPSPDELISWRETIRKVADAADEKNSLTDLGIKLATIHGNGKAGELIAQARPSLAGIESTLGLISHEAAFAFQSGGRKTITSQQSTQQTFDVSKMTALLDGKNSEIIRKVKAIISDPEFKYIDPGDLHVYREKVLQWCHHLADQGFGAMAYPKEYGGKADMAAYFAIMEALSYHDLSLVIKFGVQFGLWGMSVYFLGTEKHHKKYLKDIGTLDIPGCFAMTETNHGSNVKGIETTATYNHASKTFTIHTPNEAARKEFIGNAARHGQMATVFAKLILDGKDYGVSAFVVPLRDKNGNTVKGVTIKDCGRKMGLNGVDNGVIYFDNVVIPKDEMLDKFAGVSDDGKFVSPISSDNRRFFTMLGTLVGGRIGIPRSGLSASKTGLTIAIRYGDKRRQFGPEAAAEVPILNYRTHQRRLMPRLAKAYALHFSLQYLTERFLKRTEEQMQEIEALAAGLKSYATWYTTSTLQECRECCGGKGFLSENRIEVLKNDSDVYTTFEGDNTVLMQLVAKSRLTEFKQEFSNMNVFSILNYVADQAKTSITELNPIIVRNTDEEHLLDPEFQLNAFKYRERDILTSAAKRLKRHLDDGMDSFDAFNVCQHHLVQVGQAYIDRIILEQFMRQIDNTKDTGCKAVLKKLCDLFALSTIDENKGWYLEQGYMEGVKTKAVRKLMNQLCWDVRQEAVPLVNAFDIPDSCLAAPIGKMNQ
ncbi:MAG TPA: acyl-CoA dehydrogenase [Cyclobacteriaceae bacterium]|nr:acyl-CoA dehydrogenase [Cyclobacteriaceae bacterium]